MGRFSAVANTTACVWTLFVTIVFILPTVRPVEGATMNYAIVFLAGILLFAALFWYSWGKKYYTGPLVEAGVDENSSADAGSGSRSSSEKPTNDEEVPV